RVRQRVSRLRRHFKAHWQREVAILAALGVIVSALVLLAKRPPSEPIAADRDPAVEPHAAMWKEALARCEKDPPRVCLERLDDASRLDPAGSAQPEVVRVRGLAERSVAPAPLAPAPVEPPPQVAPKPSSTPSKTP